MSKKILIVDDEETLVKMIQIRLSSLGYQVVGASNGKECLEKVTSEKPDLIILDILMP